ncbi:apolipoprotein N-acyltransferase [Virgisporangium ochraceum]|uniref:Apolipoprotein N-acyltransferase n=1 Tax=Virgisporangium ochraceum TaxID=65505 RepID=A0A8J4A003_9ACTN|nr:apolipoprotein N-acyltransferase [Virgisporangium ochraceum]GIJ73354.1 apolipoprotein N-acyltransferase [Virgisporangium ochraceum]
MTVLAARPANEGPDERESPRSRGRSVLVRLRPVLLAVAAAVALILAFPPHDLWFLAPVGVAAFALATHGRRTRSGAALGFLTGAILFGVMLTWTSTQAGRMPWLLLSGLQAAYLAAQGAAAAYTSPLVVRRPWLIAPVTAVLWTLQEALRGRVPFGGFPWGRLAFSQGDSPLLGFAAVGGAPLVTFATALVGGLLVALFMIFTAPGSRTGRAGFTASSLKRAAAVTGAAVLTVVAGLAVPTTAPRGRAVTVAIVQGNVPRLGLDFNAQRRAVLDNHVNGTLELARRVAAGEAAKPDLVVWPENASDIDPLRNPDAARLISEAADAVDAPILVGTLGQAADPEKIINVGQVWHPSTGPGERYIKQHPVPFAEYVPFRSLARKVTDKVDLVRRDFAAGDRPGVLQLGPARIGDVICFEVAYDGIVRDTVLAGGQILAVQTNNATFNVAEAEQQLAMVRLRAVEHGRDALMASTVGVSGFVDAHGRVYGATSFFTAAVVIRELHIDNRRTLATRLGAGPEYLFVAGALVALVAAALVRRRAKTEEEQ